MAGTYRKKALAELPNQCARCASKERLEVHHLDRDRQNHDITNLQLLCHDCHYWEHHLRHREEYDQELKSEFAERDRDDETAYQALGKTTMVVSLPDVLLARIGTSDMSRLFALLVARELKYGMWPFRQMLESHDAHQRTDSDAA